MAFGSSSRLKVIIEGDDQSKRAFESVRREAKETDKTLAKSGDNTKKFWKTLGGEGEHKFNSAAAVASAGGAAGAIAAVGIEAGAAALKYEDHLERLKTALKNANVSYDSHKKAIEETVNANIKLGTYEDDTIDLLSQGVTATGSLEKATSLLSVAQNAAVAYGKPLADVYAALIKGSEGQIRPLKQLGIDLPVVAGGAQKTKVAYEALLKAQQNLKDVQAAVNSQDQNVTVKNARAIFDAKQRLQFLEQRAAGSKKHSVAQTQELVLAEQNLARAEQKGSDTGAAGKAKLKKAEDAVTQATQKLTDVSQAGAKIIQAVDARTTGQATAHSKTRLGQLQAEQAQYDQLKTKLGEFELDFVSRELNGWGKIIHAIGVAGDALKDFLGISGPKDKTILGPNGIEKGSPIGHGPAAISAPGKAPAKPTARPEDDPNAPDAPWRQVVANQQALEKWLKAQPRNVTIQNIHAQPTPAKLAASGDRHAKRNGLTSTPAYTATAPPAGGGGS